MQSPAQPALLSQYEVDARNRNKMSRFLQSLLRTSWTLKQEASGRSDPRPAIHVTGEPFGRLLIESMRLLADHLGAEGKAREWQRHEFLVPVVLDRVQAAIDADFDSFFAPAEPAQLQPGREAEVGRAQAQRAEPGTGAAPLPATNTAPAPAPASASAPHPAPTSAKTAPLRTPQQGSAPIAPSSAGIAVPSAPAAAETARPSAAVPAPTPAPAATAAAVQVSHSPRVSLVRAPPAHSSLPPAAASAPTPSPAPILPPAVASTAAPAAAAASAAAAAAYASPAPASAAPASAVPSSAVPASASSLSFNFSFRTPLQPGLHFPREGSGSGSGSGAVPRLERIDSNTDSQDLIQHRVVFSVLLPTPLRTDSDVAERLLRTVATLERGGMLRPGDVEWAAPVAAGVFPVLQHDSGRLALVMQLRRGMRVKSLLQAVHKNLDWQASPWAETEVAELSARFGSGAGSGGPGPRSVCRNVFKAVGGELPGAPRCKTGAACKFSHDPTDLHELYRLSRESSAPPRQEVVPAPRPSARSTEREERRRSRSRSRSRSRERDGARRFHRHSHSRSRSPVMSVASSSSSSSHQAAGQPRSPVRRPFTEHASTSRRDDPVLSSRRPRSPIPAAAAASSSPRNAVAASAAHQATSSMVAAAAAAPAALPLDGLAADNLPWRCTLSLLPGLVFADAAISLSQAALQPIDSRTSDLSLLRRRMVVRHVPPRRPLSSTSSDADLRADLNLLCTMMKQGIAQPSEIEFVARVVPCTWSRNEHWAMVQLRPAAASDIPTRVTRFHTANPSRPDFHKLASWFAADLAHLTTFYSATAVGTRDPCIPYFTRLRAEDPCKFEVAHRKCADSHSVAEVRALMEKRAAQEQAADTASSQPQAQAQAQPQSAPFTQPESAPSSQPESQPQGQAPAQAPTELHRQPVTREMQHPVDVAMDTGDAPTPSSAAAAAAAAAVPDAKAPAPQKAPDGSSASASSAASSSSFPPASASSSSARPAASSGPASNDDPMPRLEFIDKSTGAVRLLPAEPVDDVKKTAPAASSSAAAASVATTPKAPMTAKAPTALEVPFPLSFRTPLQPHGLVFPVGGAPELSVIDADTDDPLLMRNRFVVSGQSLNPEKLEESLLNVVAKLRPCTSDPNHIEWIAALQDSLLVLVVQLRPSVFPVRRFFAAARRAMTVQSWCMWETEQLVQEFGEDQPPKKSQSEKSQSGTNQAPKAQPSPVCTAHFGDEAAPAFATSRCSQGDQCSWRTELQKLYQHRAEKDKGKAVKTVVTLLSSGMAKSAAPMPSQKRPRDEPIWVKDEPPAKRAIPRITLTLLPPSGPAPRKSLPPMHGPPPTLSFEHQLSRALFNVGSGFSLKPFDGRSNHPDELKCRIVVRHLNGLSDFPHLLKDSELDVELHAACENVVNDFQLARESVEWIAHMPTIADTSGLFGERSVVLQLRSADEGQIVERISHHKHSLQQRTLRWPVYEVLHLNSFVDKAHQICMGNFVSPFGLDGCQAEAEGKPCHYLHDPLDAHKLIARRKLARDAILAAQTAHSSAFAAKAHDPANGMVDAAAAGMSSAHYQSSYAAAAYASSAGHFAVPAAAMGDAAAATESPFLALHLFPDGSTQGLQHLARGVAYSADMEVLRRRLVMRNTQMRVRPRSSEGASPAEVKADLRSVVDSLFLQGLLQQDEVEWIARSCAPTAAIRAPAVVLQLRPHVPGQRARDLAVGSLAFIVEDERRQLNALAEPVGKSSRICRYRFLELHLGANSFIRCNEGDRCEWSHSEVQLAKLNQSLEAAMAAGTTEPRLCAPLGQRVALPLLDQGEASVSSHSFPVRRMPPSC